MPSCSSLRKPPLKLSRLLRGRPLLLQRRSRDSSSCRSTCPSRRRARRARARAARRDARAHRRRRCGRRAPAACGGTPPRPRAARRAAPRSRRAGPRPGSGGIRSRSSTARSRASSCRSRSSSSRLARRELRQPLCVLPRRRSTRRRRRAVPAASAASRAVRGRARAPRAPPCGRRGGRSRDRRRGGSATAACLPAATLAIAAAQLVLALLHRGDALRELPLQALEGGPLLGERRAFLGDRVVAGRAPLEHHHMVRRTARVPCRERGVRRGRGLGRALEALFGARPTHDVVALAEADSRPELPAAAPRARRAAHRAP